MATVEVIHATASKCRVEAPSRQVPAGSRSSRGSSSYNPSVALKGSRIQQRRSDALVNPQNHRRKSV